MSLEESEILACEQMCLHCWHLHVLSRPEVDKAVCNTRCLIRSCVETCLNPYPANVENMVI
jgi:hypothetical protein